MTKANVAVFGVLCIALGASLAANFSGSAQAQTKPAFRECYFMKVWWANGGSVADKLAAVPAGWVPVGGGDLAAQPGVVLCR